MLDNLYRKEKVLTSLKNSLINKGYSFKTLMGINARLDIIEDIKCQYNTELLKEIIESTNYPILNNIIHGIDNVYLIDKRKDDWYLYAINKNNMSSGDIKILQESFLDNNTLIYISEKSIGGKFINFYVIFSKNKYINSHEYISHKWQER